MAKEFTEIGSPDELDTSTVDELAAFEEQFFPTPTNIELDEDDLREPFIGNRAQSKFRAAALSGKFDTLIAAGTISSSKTYGIIALMIELCLKFEDTHFLVVRAKWGNLLDNTIPDFHDILAAFPPEMYSWPNRLTCVFWTGSRIRFRPAREQQDPKFSWLKGMKLDGAFADEYDGLSVEFISMLQSRVGVQRLRKNPLAARMPPMAFFACNPNISHPKEDYSKHIHNNASLIKDRKYFQLFTIDDNWKYIGAAKLAQWKKTMTPPMYKCFVDGNWDAMSELEQLIQFEIMDKCKDIIPNDVDGNGKEITWEYYLGVDPARYGPDKCAFMIMHGPNIFKLDFFASTSIPDVEIHTRKLMTQYNISAKHVTIDAEGLGAGVVDNLAADHIYVNQFKGSNKPDDAVFYQIDPTDPNSKQSMDNYHFSFYNKRATAFWQVMQMMDQGKIGGFNPDVLGWEKELNLYEVLRQDLASIHYKFASGTKCILIEGKDEIKKRLKRSPDFADVLAYVIFSYLYDSRKPDMSIQYL